MRLKLMTSAGHALRKGSGHSPLSVCWRLLRWYLHAQRPDRRRLTGNVPNRARAAHASLSRRAGSAVPEGHEGRYVDPQVTPSVDCAFV